jgi:fibronectin type 3 domain-containing protein
MMHRTLKVVAIFILSVLITACTGTASDYYTSGSGSTTLTWDAPTQNSDNTSLDDLNRYVIYYGPASGALAYSVIVQDPTATSFVVENLRVNITYIFAITAVNDNGVESDLSNIVTKMITQ